MGFSEDSRRAICQYRKLYIRVIPKATLFKATQSQSLDSNQRGIPGNLHIPPYGRLPTRSSDRKKGKYKKACIARPRINPVPIRNLVSICF